MKSVQNKKLLYLAFPLFLTVGVFFVGHYAAASWAEDIMTGILGIFVWALGLILVLVIQGLVFIASIQEFVQAQPVVLGWVIVRDICNMFFVVILMIIAFGTILHLENYNYKKWLPKLILMAVLINFSKTICGLLIDVAQVVMLTFVNAFKDVGGANLTEMLGITSIVQMDNNDGFSTSVVGAYVLGVIYLLVAIVVIITMMAMLAMRLVMIWIYVVLSPAAYLLAAFPGGQKYASQWWSEFIKNLIVGPVLAFFIWLSLASLSGPKPQTFNTDSVDANVKSDLNNIAVKQPSVTGSKAGQPSALIKFIIGIGMLIGGLKISSEIGGAAGSMAGKGMGALSKGKGLAMGAGVGALALAKKGIKTTGMAAINQKSVRNLLDSAGMQRGGFVGQALKFTGVRGLARKGSLALGSHKLEVEENAKKKVEAFKKVGATKTLASIASGKATTISQKAAKSEARKMVVVPEEHFEKRRGAVGLAAAADKREAEARIRDLDLTKNPPSGNQLMQLGKSGINLANVPKFKDFLEKNSVARGTYNSGQRDGGLHNYVIGKDKNGRELTGPGRFGVLTINRDDVNKATGRTGDTTYALRENDDNDEREEKIKRSVTEATTKSTVIQNTPEIMNQRKRISDLTGNSDKDLIERTRNKISDWNIKDGTDYFSDDNQVKEAFRQSKDDQIKYRQEGEEKKEEKKEVTSGSGSLSVNGFARGQGSVVGIDFEKLNPEIQNKMKANLRPGRNLQDIKGAQVSDQSEIKKIATSLIESIDNEIKTIKSRSKGSEITKSDSLRLNNLEIAKGKLKDPEKISNLELVNSSARGYTSASDVKETMIHEGIHGLGIDSESDTRYITNAAMTAPSPQEREEIRTGGSRFMEHLENKMDLDSGNSSRRNRSVQAVIKDEDEDEDWDEYSLRADKPEKAVNETTKTANVTNVTNIINKNEKEKIKQDYNNSVKNNDNSFMAYYFKHLITSLNKLNSSLDKKSKAGDPLGLLKSSDGNQSVDKKDDNNLNNNLVA